MSRSYSHVFTLTIGAVEAQRPDECRCRSSHGVEAHNPKLFKRDIEPELTSEPGGQTKTEINPMNQRHLLQALQETPRCNARTRTGTPCQCPAIRGRKRCRLHGGLYWQTFFDERAGIAEFDGGLSRAKEAQAGCGAGDRPGDPLLPFGTEVSGLAWLHGACWPAWHRARQADAVTALSSIGIRA
jgi:hypothetical protein